MLRSRCVRIVRSRHPIDGGVTKFAQLGKEVAPILWSKQEKTLDSATTSRVKHQRAACHFRALCVACNVEYSFEARLARYFSPRFGDVVTSLKCKNRGSAGREDVNDRERGNLTRSEFRLMLCIRMQSHFIGVVGGCGSLLCVSRHVDF